MIDEFFEGNVSDNILFLTLHNIHAHEMSGIFSKPKICRAMYQYTPELHYREQGLIAHEDREKIREATARACEELNSRPHLPVYGLHTQRRKSDDQK